MAGYRRVNYYELCRLCTSSEGTKMHIFREEGRRRSLPSKIQTCLPLQVQEEDSLPKIICSSCVEKLESYFEFREACINAEAMLESYFTSLKYSEDLTREGKVSVYVKEEPLRTKNESPPTTAKVKIPVNNVANINNVTPIGDGNAILPSAIQIITDSDGNRLTQYKVQVQGGIPALVPYAEQSALPLSVSIPALTPQPLKQQSTSTSNNSTSSDGTQTTSDSRTIPPPPPLVAAVAIAPPNQDILHQIGLAAKDRNTLAEVLKLKNISILEPGACEPVAVSSPQIHGNHIGGQVSNIIPAQIRLDQSQLQQFLSSNIQINLGQLQQGERETVVQNKDVSVGTSVDNSENDEKSNESEKSLVEKEEVEEKEVMTEEIAEEMSEGAGEEVTEEMGEGEEVAEEMTEEMSEMTEEMTEETTEETSREMTAVNGNDERCNDSLSAKSNSSGNEVGKGDESSKFGSNGDETEQILEGDVEETQEENPQSGTNEENQSFECDMCTKTFRRKEHLFQHKKSHSGERPFVCSTCTKAFSRKEHLLRHIVSHTGQKLYGCDVCHKSFSRKDNLHKHKKTHGLNSPHVCETCGRSFVIKHYFEMHKAQHEKPTDSSGVPLKSLLCTTSTEHPLRYKCDICPKSFSIRSYLITHRLRHRSKNRRNQPPQEQQQEESQQQQEQQLQMQLHPQIQEQQPSSELTIPQPAIITSFPAAAANLNLATLNTQLATINPSALLAPNIIHHSNGNVIHIGNNSYLCTSNVTSELLEQYRRMHSS